MNFLTSSEISKLILVLSNGIAISILFLCIVYVWSWKQRRKTQRELRTTEALRDIQQINENVQFIAEKMGQIHMEHHKNDHIEKIKMEEALEEMFSNKSADENVEKIETEENQKNVVEQEGNIEKLSLTKEDVKKIQIPVITNQRFAEVSNKNEKQNNLEKEKQEDKEEKIHVINQYRENLRNNIKF